MSCETLATKKELLELEDKILNLLKGKIDKSDRHNIVQDGGIFGEKLVAAGLGFGTISLAGATLNGNQQFLASLQKQVTYTKTTLAANAQKTNAEINQLSQYQQKQNLAFENNIAKKADINEIKSLQKTLNYNQNQYIKEVNTLKNYLAEKPTHADLIAKGKEILAKQEADKAQLKTSIDTVDSEIKNNVKPLLNETNKIAGEANVIAKDAKSLAGKAIDGLGKAVTKFAPLLALLNLVGFVADLINILTVWTYIDSLNKQIDALSKENASLNNSITSLYSIAASQKSEIKQLKTKLDATSETASKAVNDAGFAQSIANGALTNAVIAQTQAANANSNAMAAGAAADQAYAIANQASIELKNLQTKVQEQFKAIESDIQGLQVNQTLTLAQLIAIKGKIGQLELTISALTQKLSNSAAYLQVATQAAKQAINIATTAIALAEKALTTTGGGGASVALKGDISNLKNQISKLEGKFAEDHKLLYQTTTKVQEQLKGNITEKTTKYIDQKLTQTKEEYQKLNSEQVKQIQQSLKEQSIDPKLFVPLLAIPAIDALLKKQNTQLNTIANNTKGGKTKCLAPVYVPPVQATATANLKATNFLQSVTIVQSGFIQKSVNNVSNVVKTINTKVGTAIPNGGLGGAISRLYTSLSLDRWLNMINTALLFHNAAMLSRNLGETAISAIGAIFNFVGIKFHDAAGNEQSLNEVVTASYVALAKHILGEDNYTALTTNWKKASAIYTAAANILSTIHSMVDGTQSLLNLAIENTGRVGNALRRAGAIFEREGLFTEKATAVSKYQKQFNDFSEAVEGAENIFANVENVTGELVNIGENSKQLKEQREAFDKSVKDWNDTSKTNSDLEKVISASPQIETKDLIKPSN